MDPVLPASLTATENDILERLANLERRFNQIPAALPSVPVFGAVQDNGYWSHSTTTPTTVLRIDGYVMARTLDYDIQTTDTFATGAPTSIEWEIEIQGFGAFADQTVASGTGAPGQYADLVDLVTLIGEDVLSRFVSFRVKVGHTGGTGDAAAIRLNKPLALRITPA